MKRYVESFVAAIIVGLIVYGIFAVQHSESTRQVEELRGIVAGLSDTIQGLSTKIDELQGEIIQEDKSEEGAPALESQPAPNQAPAQEQQ